MKQDEFTKSLNTILGQYGKTYQELASKLSKKIFQYMESGETVAQAYRKAIREVGFAEINAAAVEDAVYESALKGYGVTAPPVLAKVEGEAILRHKLMDVAWNEDGLNLSTRLHGVEKALHNNVRDTVGRALRQYKTIHQTAMLLYDGYNNPEKVLNEAELPKYLEKIKTLTTRLYSGDVKAAKESEIYRRAEHDIKKLKTPGLRAAYDEAAKAATEDRPSALKKARKMLDTGRTKEEVEEMLLAERKKALDKALYVATQEKTRYYAERIARTESARAYYEGQVAQAADNPDIFGFQWKMSSAHVHNEKSDCDCYAYSKLDIGYGPGVFPKADVPELPAHPNCMCHLRKIYEWEVQHTDGKDKLPEKPKRGKNRVEEAADEAGLKANGESGEEASEAQAAFIGTIDPKDAGKTISWYEEKIVSQEHESAIIVSESGEVFRVEGGPANVNFAVVGKEKLKGASVTHNHPAAETRYSFSSYDIGEFFENDLKSLRGVDRDYVYELEKTADTIAGTKQIIINEFSDKYYKEMLDMVANDLVPEGFSIDRDGYHTTVELMARDYKFNYRRTKK